MKRALFALFLCLSLIFGLFAAPASAEEPQSWIEAYEEILNTWRAQLSGEVDDFGYGPTLEYLIYDVDKDGSPELVVKAGTCEADYHGALYTFRNGHAFQVGEELGLGHSSFYTDPGENGIILMVGHMGYAWAERLSITDGFASETLYEDNLNARLESDPDAAYVYPGDVIPGSVYLTFCRGDLTIGLTHYGEIMRSLAGEYPAITTGLYPEPDAAFYEDLMANNGEVYAVTADGFTNSPGKLGFRELLRQDVAANWMQGDLVILSAAMPGDINNDGRLDCVLAASDGTSEMRIVLSKQDDGVVYAYLLNYTNGYEQDEDGNFLSTLFGVYRFHLVFEKEQAFLLTLP